MKTDQLLNFAVDVKGCDFLTFIATTFTNEDCGVCRAMLGSCYIISSIWTIFGAYGFTKALYLAGGWVVWFALWRLYVSRYLKSRL